MGNVFVSNDFKFVTRGVGACVFVCSIHSTCPMTGLVKHDGQHAAFVATRRNMAASAVPTRFLYLKYLSVILLNFQEVDRKLQLTRIRKPQVCFTCSDS